MKYLFKDTSLKYQCPQAHSALGHMNSHEVQKIPVTIQSQTRIKLLYCILSDKNARHIFVLFYFKRSKIMNIMDLNLCNGTF